VDLDTQLGEISSDLNHGKLIINVQCTEHSIIVPLSTNVISEIPEIFKRPCHINLIHDARSTFIEMLSTLLSLLDLQTHSIYQYTSKKVCKLKAFPVTTHHQQELANIELHLEGRLGAAYLAGVQYIKKQKKHYFLQKKIKYTSTSIGRPGTGIHDAIFMSLTNS
jgi:hypothetical protein